MSKMGSEFHAVGPEGEQTCCPADSVRNRGRQ